MEELLEKIRNALQNLITLEIVTAVGPITGGPEKKPDIDWSEDPKVILTKIDLIQGDIKTLSLTIEDGASVNGKINMSKDKIAEEMSPVETKKKEKIKEEK